ncbi:MAG: PAS domain-containing protein [Gammaproteobacteria bacterium]
MTASPRAANLDPHVLRALRKVHAGACVVMVALGLTVLTGWALNLEQLKNFGMALGSMKANTAFAFVVAGITLWLRRENRSDKTQRLAQAGGAIVAALGALTLCEYLTGFNLGIDQFFLQDHETMLTSSPGRMSFNSAVGFSLGGAALMLIETRAGPWLAAAATLPALVSMASYLYGAERLIGLFLLTGMKPHTIAGMLALSAGVLCARPARGAVAWFASAGSQGMLLRKLLPGGIAILLATAFFSELGYTTGLYDAGYRGALELVAVIVMLSALVLWAAAVLARVETARTLVAETLRERESDLRQLIETLPQLVWTCRADGPCDYLSPQWVAYTGIPEHEQLGYKWLQQVHPDDRQGLSEAWSQAMKADRSYFESEYRIQGADKRYRWFKTRAAPVRDEMARVVKWIGTGRDVDDHKRAEESLRHSEERLGALVAATAQIVWTANAQGEIVDDSPSWRAYTGQTYEQCLGRGWQNAVHPEDRAHGAQTWATAVANKSVCELQDRIRRADGIYRWTLVRAVPLLDETGAIREWVGMTIDINEQRRAEEAMQAALTEKTVLLNEIHHRVKNNLQIIAGLLQLQAGNTRDDPIKMALAEGKSRVETMALVHQLLYESGDFSQIALSVYLRRLGDLLLASYCADPVRIRLRLDVDDAKLELNRLIPIGLLVHELLCNALKHAFPAGDGGEINVNLREHVADGSVTLTVSDTGVGLPAGLNP